MALRVGSGDLFTPTGGNPLEAGPAWAASLMTGSLAVTLSVLAIALLGFLLLTGRFPVRHMGRVVLGVFILLGSATIASALAGFAERGAQGGPAVVYSQAPPVQRDLPPAEYDPYAGASLRRD